MLTTREVSQRLGVSRAQVGVLIRDGVLTAQRFGSQWAIDEETVLRQRRLRGQGRRVSESTRVAALEMLSGVQNVSGSVSARTLARIRAVFRTGSSQAVLNLVTGTGYKVGRYSAVDVEGMRNALILTGQAAAEQITTDLTASAQRLTEGYLVAGMSLERARQEFLLFEDDSGEFLVHRECAVTDETGDLLASVIARDLALSSNAREAEAGMAALERMRVGSTSRPR